MDGTSTSGEKKLTLLLLCWIFGLFAVHRFYTGKYLTGGLQVFAFVLAGVLAALQMEAPAIVSGAVGGLWLIADFMRIIMGKFTDKEGRPITDWV